MLSLSFSVCDDQQSAMFVFTWNGGLFSQSTISILFSVVFNSDDKKYQQALELIYCKETH